MVVGIPKLGAGAALALPKLKPDLSKAEDAAGPVALLVPNVDETVGLLVPNADEDVPAKPRPAAGF